MRKSTCLKLTVAHACAALLCAGGWLGPWAAGFLFFVGLVAVDLWKLTMNPAWAWKPEAEDPVRTAEEE